MHKLLIKEKQWKDCPEQSLEDILYVARTLSKYSSCRVEVYDCSNPNKTQIASFLCGRAMSKEQAA